MRGNDVAYSGVLTNFACIDRAKTLLLMKVLWSVDVFSFFCLQIQILIVTLQSKREMCISTWDWHFNEILQLFARVARKYFLNQLVVSIVYDGLLEGFQIDFRGMYRRVPHGLRYDGYGYITLVGTGCPGVPRHV